MVSYTYWISSITVSKSSIIVLKMNRFESTYLEDDFDDFFSDFPELFISVLVITVVLFFFFDVVVSDGSVTVT